MTNHIITVLSILIQEVPIGTNLALLHFFWMLISGALLPNRGAIFPALKSIGLSDAATRRAWTAFRKGVWQISALLVFWREYVKGLAGWQERQYEGYLPITVDITAIWRPSLKNCPSKHYHPAAHRALPAVIFGIVGGYLICVYVLELSSEDYINSIKNYVELSDITGGLTKSAVFGLILSWVGCYKGYRTTGGARGVGISTTQSVVLGSILILISNYFLTKLLEQL